MRYGWTILGAVVLVMLGMFGSQAGVSYAAFHCMRIHAVKAGFGGNGNIQYVELRMDFGGQTFVSSHTLEFRDASGTLKATVTFPANMTNGNVGDSILIATSEFNTSATGGMADFTFSNTNTVGANGGDPLHPVQAPNGKVSFSPTNTNCNVMGPPVDSVAAGTAAADYGSAAVALPPATDNRALRLSNLNQNPTNNSTEYSLNAVSSSTFAVAPANLPTDFSTPRNNGRVVIKLGSPIGGIAEEPDVSGLSTSTSSKAGGDGFSRIWYGLGGAFGLIAVSLGVWAIWRRRVHYR